MSALTTPPPFKKASEEDAQLVSDLVALSKKSPKLVKSSIYGAPADPAIKVRSWKMNEFKYYDVPSPFPTLARGLFTVEQTEPDTNYSQHRIIARGYDKFFNIGEVPWTTWASIEAHTKPPYILSLKSNGCIIFVAALTPSKLLVTSKHSIGPIENIKVSHAQAGESWLRKYLEQKGKTEEELAGRLWENNWTIISELCDDSFEEHVLSYSPEKTGLHLHGINVSTKAFITLPPDQVDAFADEWGFIKTPTNILNTVNEVKAFTERIGEIGEWNGEAVEGFVVRTHVTEPPMDDQKTILAVTPYSPGSSFFFKVKFDEPYMMYRDWREVTKMLLTSKGPMSISKLPKSKMKRPETKVYAKWAIDEIERDRSLFSGYLNNKGIIANRVRFLRWLETRDGKKELADNGEQSVEEKSEKKTFGKTVIVPVAIPGCGKTTVALALSHIYGFGHTQSDDVRVKKSAPAFIKNVKSLLDSHNIVIADKNNHLRQHRQALRDAVSNIDPPVRLLALNWDLDQSPAMVHRICSGRIVRRGDNHQSLIADAEAKSHEDVIWGFINSTEELTSAEVDETIEMELGDTSEQAVKRAIDGIVKILGLPMPSEDKIHESLAIIESYSPTFKRPEDTKKKVLKPRYFALLPEIDLVETLEARLLDATDITEKSKAFWNSLKQNKRIAKRPHVTIVHKNSPQEERDALWDQCAMLNGLAIPPLFSARLGRVLLNDKVMAVTVEDVKLDDSSVEQDTSQLGHEFVSKLPHDLRERMHITVGTKDDSIAPLEGKVIVENWKKSILDKDFQSMTLDGITIRGLVKGLAN